MDSFRSVNVSALICSRQRTGPRLLEALHVLPHLPLGSWLYDTKTGARAKRVVVTDDIPLALVCLVVFELARAS